MTIDIGTLSAFLWGDSCRRNHNACGAWHPPKNNRGLVKCQIKS